MLTMKAMPVYLVQEVDMSAELKKVEFENNPICSVKNVDRNLDDTYSPASTSNAMFLPIESGEKFDVYDERMESCEVSAAETSESEEDEEGFYFCDISRGKIEHQHLIQPISDEMIRRKMSTIKRMEQICRSNLRSKNRNFFSFVFKRKSNKRFRWKSFDNVKKISAPEMSQVDDSFSHELAPTKREVRPIISKPISPSKIDPQSVLDTHLSLSYCAEELNWVDFGKKRHMIKKYTKSGGVVQEHPCHELCDISFCLECVECRHSDTDTDYCRFMDFRKILRSNGVLHAVGFVAYSNKTNGNTSWDFLPPSESRKDWSVHTACFVLRNIYPHFKKWVAREENFLLNALRYKFLGSPTEVLPWRDATNIRELCDVCLTTIFNLHLICKNCAFGVCIECLSARLRRELRRENPSLTQDNFGWSLCSKFDEKSKIRRAHSPTDFRLAHLIPDIDSTILSTLKLVNLRLNEQIKRYCLNSDENQGKCVNGVGDSSIEKTAPHSFIFDGSVLLLNCADHENNFCVFQRYWHASTPLIVENTHRLLTESMWTPQVFQRLCFDKSSWVGSIVDCRTGAVIDDVDAATFWTGFTDCHKRIEGLDGRKLYLKLKDWPSSDKFSNLLKGHYEDFCRALPIKEYTHPRNAVFNLVANLPSFCVEPDLGPKMYTAYEMIFEEKRGTTNLHLDISCAVNLMVSVTTPANVNWFYLKDSILRYLETQDLDPADFERAKRKPAEAGALWTIFKPEDSETLRSFLIELADEQRNSDIDDPIHDQMCYLHADLRKRLELERGVKGFTFVQMLGDAVFIPAGAAHQVQNLLCCIKVAEDFVSPEGVARCAAVAGEFRHLTKMHTNHEDKLQLPNIVLHSVREAIRTLELNEPSSIEKL